MKRLRANIELEEGLAMIGFIALVVGLAFQFGLSVAAIIGGGILFGLGVGLAIYKGAH